MSLQKILLPGLLRSILAQPAALGFVQYLAERILFFKLAVRSERSSGSSSVRPAASLARVTTNRAEESTWI
jgi:hypothetical protein